MSLNATVNSNKLLLNLELVLEKGIWIVCKAFGSPERVSQVQGTLPTCFEEVSLLK